MPVYPFDLKWEDAYAKRLSQLKPDSERKFGTLDATQMLRHMRLSYEMACGETDLEPAPIPLGKLVFHIVTGPVKIWPGGKLKAPAYWSPPAEHDFDEEMRLLTQSMSRFLEKLVDAPGEVNAHPMMGKLTVKEWSKLLGPHLNHHLRQFGL